MKQIYIAGPMSGYPEFNFPAFFTAAYTLERQGWKVWNPAAKDSEDEVQSDGSFNTGDSVALVANGWDYKAAILWDLDKVINSDAIYMLPGWEFSPGACAEHAVAKFIKKQNPEYKIIYG
jgi:hypothetical protein